MTLYDLRVVSLGTAAGIAKLSLSECVDALGRAGVSVFQYDADELWSEVAELKAR
jgi:predicted HTH domain antitoxin